MGNSKGDFKQQIADVYFFSNGNVTVIDQRGRQMPFFNGPDDALRRKRIMDRIKRQDNKIVNFHGAPPYMIDQYHRITYHDSVVVE